MDKTVLGVHRRLLINCLLRVHSEKKVFIFKFNLSPPPFLFIYFLVHSIFPSFLFFHLSSIGSGLYLVVWTFVTQCSCNLASVWIACIACLLYFFMKMSLIYMLWWFRDFFFFFFFTLNGLFPVFSDFCAYSMYCLV